jgi:hypothetical protein
MASIIIAAQGSCRFGDAGMHAVAVRQLNSVLRLGADVYTVADQPLIHANDIDVDASIAARVADLDPDATGLLAQ